MKLWNGKYLVVRRDGTAPAWPSFVLGARDPGAPAALRSYVEAHIEAAKKARKDHDKEYLQSVLDLAEQFELYNMEHGDGDPEAGPWRAEAHDVISALKGETSVVVVFPDKDNKRTKPPKD